jgi:hypothetical protein
MTGMSPAKPGGMRSSSTPSSRPLGQLSMARRFSHLLGTGALALGVLLLAPAGCGVSDEDGDEPKTAEEESALQVACGGPFNCKLPNPDGNGTNRATNHHDGTLNFPIVSNVHLRDGAGNVRGVVARRSVQVNYGQRKILAGSRHVYAFSTHLTSGLSASGWVREGALAQGNITYMPTVRGRDPGQGDYATTFTIVNGPLDTYRGLKVGQNIAPDGGVNATDYLGRTGGVVNLLYNLPGYGGVSTDSFPLGTQFHRSHGVSEVAIPLYHPESSVRVGHLNFVYGHVGGRYGWIARDALDPPQATN